MAVNLTAEVAALTLRLAELEATKFDVSSANTWYLFSSGVL